MGNLWVWLCLMSMVYFTVRWALNDNRKAEEKRRRDIETEREDD